MRHRILAPINTEKHYTHHAQFNVASGAITSINVSDAVTVALKNLANEVVEGSLIKAVYLEFWLTVNGTGLGSAVMALEKRVAADPAMSFTEIQNLGAYPNKKNVLWTFEGLLPGNGQNPVPILRQWFKIPRGKQRQGLADKIVLNLASIVGGLTACGFTTYKEWK